MTEKTAIRTQIKCLRKELDETQKRDLDQAVLKNLLSLPELREGTKLPVYCYVSIGKEADTRVLMERLWQRNIPVAVPRVEGDVIRFYRIRGMEDLEPGCMRIPEPAAGCPLADTRASVVLTPGLAFTPEGARLGYGGGFYDRFFETEPEHKRIALAYPFQILPKLPAEGFDRQVDMIVTSERIYHCR